jgi:hypothetical protein
LTCGANTLGPIPSKIYYEDQSPLFSTNRQIYVTVNKEGATILARFPLKISREVSQLLLTANQDAGGGGCPLVRFVRAA